MKTLLIISLLFLSVNNNQLKAQIDAGDYKIVKIIPTQHTYLNGNLNGGFLGGKSRITIAFDLPQNTVEWFYMYSTKRSESSAQNLDLVANLTKFYDPTGTTGAITKAVLAPKGEAVADIYVMQTKHKAYFEEKDIFGGWVYGRGFGIEEGRAENATEGTQRIDDINSGRVYLGLKNPSDGSGVDITLEVVAIVSDKLVDNSYWTAEMKNKIFNMYNDKLIEKNISSAAARQISNCIVDKFTTAYTPNKWNTLSQGEQNALEAGYIEGCAEDASGGAKTEEQEKAVSYGGLGWKAYENGELDKAITYSEKALDIDNNICWVQANLGLFLLIKNQEIDAVDYYIDAISNSKKDQLNCKKYLSEYIIDIKTARTNYPNMDKGQDIVDLLQSELDRLR